MPEAEFVQRLETENIISYTGNQEAEAAYIPYLYRVGLHYTSLVMKKKSHTDSLAVVDVLKRNQAVGIISGLFDEKQTICYVCDFYLNMLHVSFEDFRKLTKDSYLSLIAPDDLEIYKHYEKGICEYRMQMPDGRLVKVRDARTVVFTETGKTQWISAIRMI